MKEDKKTRKQENMDKGRNSHCPEEIYNFLRRKKRRGENKKYFNSPPS